MTFSKNTINMIRNHILEFNLISMSCNMINMDNSNDTTDDVKILQTIRNRIWKKYQINQKNSYNKEPYKRHIVRFFKKVKKNLTNKKFGL